MKDTTVIKVKESMKDRLPPRQVLLDLIFDLSGLLAGLGCGALDLENPEVNKDIMDLTGKSLAIMKMISESQAMQLMLIEEQKQEFAQMVASFDRDTFDEVIKGYRDAEGDEAADDIVRAFEEHQNLNNLD